jgi:FemAB-related protein (PEP-CTERM system-associated)
MNTTLNLEVSCAESTQNPDEWDGFVLGLPGATFCHLLGWQRAIERTFAYKRRSLVARKDGKLAGVLPLHEVPKLPFGRCWISDPMAVYGGICADDRETAQALLDRAKHLARQAGIRYLELRSVVAIEDPELHSKDLYYTFRREIFPTEDENMAAIPRNQRRSIRIGKKNGLTARVEGTEFLDRFYDIYSHSLRNLGSPVFPKTFFKALLEEFPEHCRIAGVFKGDEMLAAVLTFFFRDQVLPYYGGAYKEAYDLAVYDFMYWSLMCYGAEKGFKVFDFGRSKRDTGSFHFKRHWGFEPQPIPYQYFLVKCAEVPNESPTNPKYSLPIRVWKRLPVAVTQWLGPRLIKYFP